MGLSSLNLHTSIATMNLSPNDVRRRGLALVHVTEQEQASKGMGLCDEMFRSVFGSPAECLSDMWDDLCHTNIVIARLNAAEKTPQGFKMFMMAHYFLWNYPRNSVLLLTPSLDGSHHHLLLI